jgi:hypothetical protein
VARSELIYSNKKKKKKKRKNKSTQNRLPLSK